jgi:hypothetical protein
MSDDEEISARPVADQIDALEKVQQNLEASRASQENLQNRLKAALHTLDQLKVKPKAKKAT